MDEDFLRNFFGKYGKVSQSLSPVKKFSVFSLFKWNTIIVKKNICCIRNSNPSFSVNFFFRFWMSISWLINKIKSLEVCFLLYIYLQNLMQFSFTVRNCIIMIIGMQVVYGLNSLFFYKCIDYKYSLWSTFRGFCCFGVFYWFKFLDCYY